MQAARVFLLSVVFASLTGCASYGGGVGIGIPVGPLSFGIGVGTGGVSAGVGAGYGPVGVGVGIDQSGVVTGGAGVGASVPIGNGPARAGVGVGTGTVLYDPRVLPPPPPLTQPSPGIPILGYPQPSRSPAGQTNGN